MTTPLLVPIRPSLVDKTPQWTFDVGTGLYTSTVTGRVLTPRELRQAVELVIYGAKQEAAMLVEELRAEEDSIAEFELGMGALLVAVHTAAAAAGTAGVPGILAEAEADLHATIAREKAYVASFSRDMRKRMLMATGAVLVALALSQNKQAFIARAQSYMGAALIGYERHRYRLMVFLDYTEGRRVMNPTVEHCIGCEREAGKGFVPIAQLVPLGNEECGQWCWCELEYRKTIPYLESI